MTRKLKYDYYQLGFDNWIKIDSENRADADLDDFRRSIESHIQANRQLKSRWQYGWNTHHPDGSYTPELVEYLAENAEYLKIHGYGYLVEKIQIWNPKDAMYQWHFQEAKYNLIAGGRMVFSDKFRSYLQSEGYPEMAIAGIEDEVHSDAGRFLQTMSPELAIQAMMEDYWAGFSCSPITGTIVEWKVAQREATLIARKLVPHQILMRAY